MTDKSTPAGRLVQGSVIAKQRTDMTTRQPLWLDAAKTQPDMGTFFSVAFPKLINGAPNAEFAAFYGDLGAIAMAAWPQFFAGGQCSNPRFSWKVIDGDGVDQQGQSVAGKAGFKGHWIVKFDSNYPIKSFYEGKWSPQDEIGLLPTSPKVADVIKRGYWIRVVYEAKSNNADLSKQQVPGLSIYPKLVSFLGGRPEDEISSGPDAEEAFGNAPVGWRPDGISAVPGAPVGGLPTPPAIGGGLALPGAALPPLGGLALPAATPAPAAPQYVVRADLAQQGHTLATMQAQGHTIDQLVAAGYLTAAAPPPPPGLPQLSLPGATPQLGGLPPLGGLALPAAGPRYQLTQKALDAVPGGTIESLTAPGNGWTVEMLVAQGYAIKTS